MERTACKIKGDIEVLNDKGKSNVPLKPQGQKEISNTPKKNEFEDFDDFCLSPMMDISEIEHKCK